VDVATEDNLNLKEAQQVLDEDHYGLDQVKERIVEYLAVRKLKPEHKGRFSASSGLRESARLPSGVHRPRDGRKFVRVSLGGVRDEAEIRGTGAPTSAPCRGASSSRSGRPGAATR